MTWLPYLLVLLVLVFVRLTIRRALGPVVGVGDECSYVQCGAQTDPYAPGQFLRVPLMAWLSKQAHCYSTNPEQTLRSATTAASALTSLASMLSAQLIGGTQAALVIGLLLVLMPGRLILSQHVWPDIWLGLWLSLACLILVYPDLPSNLRAALLGIVSALAFMTRFDALLLAPFAGFALTPGPIRDWIFVLAPTLLVFAYSSVRNARRYQIPWPDTTWMFNLMIAAGETEGQQGGKLRVEGEVLKTISVWNGMTHPDRLTHSVTSLRRLLVRPFRTFWSVLLRAWASLGPDSFVLHRLLPPTGLGYPEISPRLLYPLQIVLVLAFPLFTSATFLALLVSGSTTPVILWPTLALAAASLIHNRTRYRQAWLPGAALLLVSTVYEPNFWPTLLSTQSTVEWIAGVGLAVTLVLFRVRPDTGETL